MADDADRAGRFIDQWTESCLANVTGKKLDPGKQGDCELCGSWSGRLINGACAPCRDKYKLD